MIIKTEQFKDSCKKILETIDTTNKQSLDDTLELITINNKLHLNATNGEYYVTIIFSDTVNEDLHATINARTFLTLISKLTTEYLELNIIDNSLQVVANGRYKFPFIFDSNSKMYIPKVINIDNVVNTFTVDGNILLSILNYNTKEFSKGSITRAVQKMFYLDEEGCITFTSGACINSFKINTTAKMLLNQKLVKLFKLFKNTDVVTVNFGYSNIGGFTSSEILFKTDEITITSILTSDETLLNSVPVKAIRQRAFNTYANNVELSKYNLLAALDRLAILLTNNDTIQLIFDTSNLLIQNLKGDCIEQINYNSNGPDTKYSLYININDFKTTIESCQEQYITISYGDNQAIVITRGFIRNIIPEGHLS